MDERRASTRRTVFGKVAIQILETGEMISANGYDISLFGMCIRCGLIFSDKLTYLVNVKLGNDVFKCECRYDHVKPFNGQINKVILEYVHMTPGNKEILQKFIGK